MAGLKKANVYQNGRRVAGIPKRIQKRMDKLGVDRSMVVEYSGVSRSTLSRVLRGERKLSVLDALCLANTLGCSIEYLLTGHGVQGQMRTLAVSDREVNEIRVQGIAGRIQKMMKILEAYPAQLAKLSGVDRTILSRVFSGERKLIIINILCIAEALNVPVGYILASH